MAFAENAGSYWRGRYRLPNGEKAVVRDDQGRVIHFAGKREHWRRNSFATWLSTLAGYLAAAGDHPRVVVTIGGHDIEIDLTPLIRH